MAGDPYPKPKKKAKKARRGRARPDEPLAPWCETAGVLPHVCKGRAEQRHHILRRSQGGTDDASNTIDICGRNGVDGCHNFIHSHITEAERLGLLRRSTFTPTHEPEDAMNQQGTLLDLLPTDQGHGKPTAAAQLAVLTVLGQSDQPQTTAWIRDRLHRIGHPLAVNSIGTRLVSLERGGFVVRAEGKRTRWTLTDTGRAL